MEREDIADLLAFAAVARESSFTKAAAKLGVSQSALSHTIRRLEKRIGIRLLTRTTRSVAPTEAGERLLATVIPHFDEVSAQLAAITELRDRPAGTIRITAGEHSLRTAIWPRLDRFLKEYPDVTVEVNVDNGLVDIVSQRYDAGVRLGELVAKDMIAARIGPDWRMAVVGSPDYFLGRDQPLSPEDLTSHQCINLRLASGAHYAWEFEKDGRRLNVRVDGQLALNGSAHILPAVLAGHGLACLPEDIAARHVADGSLLQVLGSWMPTFVGYHIYYPSRRQSSPAFQLLVQALRYRE